MRILITGSNGQLGTAFIKSFPQYDLVPCVENISNPDINHVVQQSQVDAVINCAAYTNVDKSELERSAADLTNRVGVQILAEICSKRNIPLVHISTDYVFSGSSTTPYLPVDPVNPINYYGKTKALGEDVIRKLCRKYIIVRTSWLFGDSENKSNFVTKVLDWARTNETIKVVDDQISCPTYTKDLAISILSLLKREHYGVWHFSNSGICSRYDWAKFIVQQAGLPCVVLPAKSKEFPTKADRPKYSVLGTIETEKVIGKIRGWRSATLEYLNEIKIS